MQRRDFIKAAGIFLTAAAGASLYPRPANASFQGVLYKGTTGGRILASEDGGRHWETCMTFGPAAPVLDLFTRGNHLWVELGAGAHRFRLKSGDGKTWYSQDWVSPSGRSIRRQS